jgi:tRNA threonylcarbamoyladenosine biosynthesis protein TsaE
MAVVKTESLKTTKAFAAEFIESVLRSQKNRRKALVVLLSGDLGSGKTSFVQGVLSFLKIKRATSPTFVIMKHYAFLKPKLGIKNIYHIDAYRLKSFKDLSVLGFDQILKSKESLIMIEWPERILKGLPKNAVKIYLSCGEKENERVIKFPKINAR